MKKYVLLQVTPLLVALFFSTNLFAQAEFDLTTVTDNTPTSVSETLSGITMTVSTFNSGTNNTLYQASSVFGTNGIAAHGSVSQNSEEMVISFDQAVDVSDIVVNSTQFQSRTWTFTPTGGSNSVVTETNTFNGSTTVSLNFTDVTEITITSDFLFSNAEQMIFDKITIPGSFFPVELISFEGESYLDRVELTWTTASELNNERFEIETSQDGRSFLKIGEVDGNGTTTEQQDYSFEIEQPRFGNAYYRLKQIDFDGKFEYSKVISVQFEGERRAVGDLYPNPSRSGLVNLDYDAQGQDEISISVFDLTGRLMINQIQPVVNGMNNLSFTFTNLKTGLYIVKIGDGRNPTYQKLMIER